MIQEEPKQAVILIGCLGSKTKGPPSRSDSRKDSWTRELGAQLMFEGL